MCSNYDVAARLASILITFMILYSVSSFIELNTEMEASGRLTKCDVAGLSNSGLFDEALAVLDLLYQSAQVGNSLPASPTSS